MPESDLVGHDLYNQLFTMHGTVMMFLFAVPAVEAASVYLLPNMQAARDLPFPRLSAYAFWAYFVGGLVFFGTIFFGLAPNGGWFMYPPLTSTKYSPADNADWWLLGIGFIEISAIAGAIEIIVGVMKTRAVGMSLDKLPVYSWAMLVFAVMIVIGFPAIILGTLLLELERAFDWPFFIAERGGDPLLWQHLFWFFGHPEVYIIFLPATGMVSMIVPTMAQTPLVGYRLVVLALIATGFLSFGLWVHHMFATGLPKMSLSFFSAASTAVAVPSGIQVFAWIATIASGRMKLTTPSLFVIGFLFIFTLGGLTGVMVAMAPFDWQAHDSYFIVAHLHYVLIGGMVFPLFAAFYYWVPVASKHALSERLGRWVFGAHVPRRQRDLPADAHHRPHRHAAAGLHLSGRHGVGRAQPRLHHRRLHDRRRRGDLPLRSRPQVPVRERGQCGQCLECRHARMAAERATTRPAASRPSSAASRYGTSRTCRRTWRRGAITCPARRRAGARRW